MELVASSRSYLLQRDRSVEKLDGVFCGSGGLWNGWWLVGVVGVIYEIQCLFVLVIHRVPTEDKEEEKLLT